jgi:ribosomal protein S26
VWSAQKQYRYRPEGVRRNKVFFLELQLQVVISFFFLNITTNRMHCRTDAIFARIVRVRQKPCERETQCDFYVPGFLRVWLLSCASY